jgi:hypothetical protein
MGSTPRTDAHGHPHGSLDNVDVAHEHSDVSVRGVLLFAAMLAGVCIVIAIAMRFLFVAFNGMETRNDPFVTPLAAPAGQLPPEPRLQTTPWADLEQFRAGEVAHLHSYGWVNQSAGIAHVPIQRAKEMLLKKGLPVRAGENDPFEGTHVAAEGESSGGRIIPAGQPDQSSGAAAPQTAAPSSTPSPAPATPAPPKGPGGGT